jgi:DNA-binding Xre family transcriptional regulator
MPVIRHLHVMLSERIGITEQSLSLTKSGKVRRQV